MLAGFQVEGQNSNALFTLKIHRGDGMCLVAMNWKNGKPPANFVGFSIEYQQPGDPTFYPLKNRLCFPNTNSTDPNRLSTLQSPIQKFRWVHFPRNADLAGDFTYRVKPVFMNQQDQLSYGDEQEARIQLNRQTYPDQLNVAFTRGFVSSQAFVDRYQSVKGILPAKADQGLDFKPTNPKAPQALDWMGFEARQEILAVLDKAINDNAEVRMDTPELKAQRLRDDPHDHLVKFYYHWIKGGVDFVTLDNASDEQFDEDQMNWFSAELQRAAKNREIRAVVVGMHEALPDSLSAGHSMNEAPQETQSGRKVYQELVDFRRETHKNVYVLASHSHFYMENVYKTACRTGSSDVVLPGWIVGTAGAVRYRLPNGTIGSTAARTDVYGYLLGAVSPDGTIRFQFREIKEQDVPDATRQMYSTDFVESCFENNKSSYIPDGPTCP